MLCQLFDKKNEKFEIEFFDDKECTKAFDFEGKKHLYIELKYGDVNPLYEAYNECGIKTFTIYTPYIPAKYFRNCLPFIGEVKTLNDITHNLSKYIRDNNAVLFLNADYCEKYMQCFQNHYIGLYANDGLDEITLEGSIEAINEFVKNPIQKLTIFLPHGTLSELQKANEVAKELKQKYGVEEVNLFVLYCFYWNRGGFGDLYTANFKNFNKITTTNSTGILEPQDNEMLKVIDCKEIFEDYIKENN